MSATLNCPVCQGQLSTSISYPIKQPNKLNFKAILICEKCSHGRVDTNLNDLDLTNFYSSGSYWVNYQEDKELNFHNSLQAYVRVSRIAKLKIVPKSIPLRILDIGAGKGHIQHWISHFFPDQELQYYFVEPDDNLAKAILNKKNKFASYRLTKVSELEGPVDIIFLNHVIEHILEPEHLLKEITEKMHKESLLYIEVPNADYRFKDDVFPHVQFFNSKSLSAYIQKNNFKIVSELIFGSLETHRSSSFFSKVFNALTLRSFKWSLKYDLFALSLFLWKLNFHMFKKQKDGIWIALIAKINNMETKNA